MHPPDAGPVPRSDARPGNPAEKSRAMPCACNTRVPHRHYEVEGTLVRAWPEPHISPGDGRVRRCPVANLSPCGFPAGARRDFRLRHWPWPGAQKLALGQAALCGLQAEAAQDRSLGRLGAAAPQPPAQGGAQEAEGQGRQLTFMASLPNGTGNKGRLRGRPFFVYDVLPRT